MSAKEPIGGTGRMASVDEVGRIETRGVDFIPEAERHGGTGDLWAVFVGGNLALSVIVFGWLPVIFGLGWWSTVTSIAVGLALGCALVAPLALFGPRTGTNGVVSSGAHFGVRGRSIGALLVLGFGLLYAAISVWTGGDALVAGAARLVGTPEGDGARVVGYAVIAAAVVAIAIFGHATLVRVQRVLVPVLGLLLLLGIPAFGGAFDPAYAGGEYLLGDFWTTWVLAVVITAAGPVSYAGILSDYTRYMSRRRVRDRRVLAASFGSVFAGIGIAALFGAFTATTFADLESDYAIALVGAAPGWYVVPVVLLGVLGGVSQGVLNVYSTGLNTDALIPRLTRARATVLSSVVAIALVYVGTVALDAVASITAATLILNALAVPWVVVLVAGFVARRGRYVPADLQVFEDGRHGGAYWYTGGWNIGALAAWAAGSATGVLCVQSDLYTGPWAGVAGGVDITIPASGAVAAIVYVAALALRRVRRTAGAELPERAAA